jgi:hypothetical protein
MEIRDFGLKKAATKKTNESSVRAGAPKGAVKTGN